RWEIGAGLLVVGAVLEVVVWNAAAPDRTYQVMYSWMILPTTVFLTLMWWIFLSGLAWKSRLTGLGVLAVAFAGFLGCVRFDGYWGDMVPRLAWRWTPTAEQQ